jgi:hypothetical protein
MERLDKVISIINYRSRDWHDSAGNQTRVSAVGGEHSSKELFEQRVNNYSEHLLKRLWHGSRMW